MAIRQCRLGLLFSSCAVLLAGATALLACSSSGNTLDLPPGGGQGEAGASGKGEPDPGPNPGSGGQPEQITTCDGRGVLTSCSPEATCSVIGCGDDASRFDASGCPRMTCSSTRDCPAGNRCFPTILRGECTSPGVQFCFAAENEAGCSCAFTAACGSATLCIPETDVPVAADCVVEGLSCDELTRYVARLARVATPDPINDVHQALLECDRQARERQAELGCPAE
jgi:hypothetical protein